MSNCTEQLLGEEGVKKFHKIFKERNGEAILEVQAGQGGRSGELK
jgi:hypothetical protein